MMATSQVESQTPSLLSDGGTPPVLTINGSWLKMARIQDELWLEPPAIKDPDAVARQLRESPFTADIFTFAQPVPETERKYRHAFEWENWAVAATSDFEAWWSSLPHESRKNVRKAEKRGITIGPVAFDDELVRGIKALYDETPIRQGRRFWHYGKDLETVRRENSTYLHRSDFIAARLDGELVGFIKMVRVGEAARIMQILSKSTHQDKHPTNALLAAAIRQCAQAHIPHLIYGQYIYGQKRSSSVTEFKRRNGFEPILTPRYYVPLTRKGRFALATRLHRPVTQFVPEPVLNLLLSARSFALQARLRRNADASRPQSASPR